MAPGDRIVIKTDRLGGQYNWNDLRRIKFNDGWRLPTIFELMLICKQSNDKGYYWSSSPSADHHVTDSALFIGLGQSYDDGYKKSNYLHVLLVPDEQEFDIWHPVSKEEIDVYKQKGELPDWHPRIKL